MRYKIVVRGEVEAQVVDRLGPLEVRSRAGHTDVMADLVDQSHLIGLLSLVSQAGIEVISATPVPAGSSKGTST